MQDYSVFFPLIRVTNINNIRGAAAAGSSVLQPGYFNQPTDCSYSQTVTTASVTTTMLNSTCALAPCDQPTAKCAKAAAEALSNLRRGTAGSRQSNCRPASAASLAWQQGPTSASLLATGSKLAHGSSPAPARAVRAPQHGTARHAVLSSEACPCRGLSLATNAAGALLTPGCGSCAAGVNSSDPSQFNTSLSGLMCVPSLPEGRPALHAALQLRSAGIGLGCAAHALPQAAACVTHSRGIKPAPVPGLGSRLWLPLLCPDMQLLARLLPAIATSALQPVRAPEHHPCQNAVCACAGCSTMATHPQTWRPTQSQWPR